MNKILGMAAVFMAAMFATGVLATPQTATPQATVSVQATCGLSATGPIAFGTMVPGETSGGPTSTVSMLTGNTPGIPTIKGDQWSNGASLTMPVGQTSWKLTAGTYAALTDSDVSIGQQVGFGSPVTVLFQLAVPAGQAAASYTQTVTFTVNC